MILINIIKRYFEKKFWYLVNIIYFYYIDCSVLKKLYLLFGFGGFFLYIYFVKENNLFVIYIL